MKWRRAGNYYWRGSRWNGTGVATLVPLRPPVQNTPTTPQTTTQLTTPVATVQVSDTDDNSVYKISVKKKKMIV